MRILDDFYCDACGYAGEHLHPSENPAIPCPQCGTEIKKLPPFTQKIANFGMLGVAHEQGRRLSPEQEEFREHWIETRIPKGREPKNLVRRQRPKVYA